MIARLQGVIESVRAEGVLLSLGGGIVLEVLVPASNVAALAESVGRSVTLRTIFYLEGAGQGANMTPRLLGFLAERDKQLFELLTSCRGIGPRKALRAMALDSGRIAAAIAGQDHKTLQSLPEIGRKMAETVVVTLREKVRGLAVEGLAREMEQGDAKKRKVSASEGATVATPVQDVAALPGVPAGAGRMSLEAVEVLVKLGETRLAALTWVDQALAAEAAPKNVEELIARAYQIKAGG